VFSVFYLAFAAGTDSKMDQTKKTPLYDRHIKLGAKMVDFASWLMPIQYPKGIVAEHLATRLTAGLFDVSHMGRFTFKGKDALPFLQKVLSNNAAALPTGQSQYTIIPNDAGEAIDDAYLYRFVDDEFLLVVNASNTQKDWDYFQTVAKEYDQLQTEDKTIDTAMLSLQGPKSQDILNNLIDSGSLPAPQRNALSKATISENEVLISRTGYTGEPLCFELFTNYNNVIQLWDLLLNAGAEPVGLGARDTLRLEASLPLYGHEFGKDPEEKEIKIFACPLAKFAVSFANEKTNFIGKKALKEQFNTLEKIKAGDYSNIENLPRIIRNVAITGKGIARAHDKIFKNDKCVGFVTSGTMVPYFKNTQHEKAFRPIALALLDCNLKKNDIIEVRIRNNKTPALIVASHLRKNSPPYTEPIIYK